MKAESTITEIETTTKTRIDRLIIISKRDDKEKLSEL